jgi:hypothetical protein
MVNVFLNDPEFKDIKFKSMGNNADAQALYQIQQKKLRHKLYSNWTDLFQTLKPEIPDRSDKHSWLFKDPESNSYIDAYYKTMHEHISKLHPRLYKIEGRKAMYHVVGTRGFVITDLK